MEGRPISYSRLETRLRPQPGQMNTNGVMHGGMTMYHLDMACGMSAMRHSGTRVVTVSVDRMDFKSPVHPGENLLYKTSVNMVHRSSVEVGARIEAENPYTTETRHVGTAYLSFVGLNEEGKPTAVRSLLAETDEDKRRMADAVRRAYLRRMERAQSGGKAFSFPIELLPGSYLLCRCAPGAQQLLPAGCAFAVCAMTEKGITLILPDSPATRAIVADQTAVPPCRVEAGWRAFGVRASLDLDTRGIVAHFSAILAAEKISVQYISTFDSGYLLVRDEAAAAAAEALRLAGHEVAER